MSKQVTRSLVTEIGDELDLILDAFSKAHPFADTRAYNIFHDQAKAATERLLHRSNLEAAIEELQWMHDNEFAKYPTLNYLPERIADLQKQLTDLEK